MRDRSSQVPKLLVMALLIFGAGLVWGLWGQVCAPPLLGAGAALGLALAAPWLVRDLERVRLDDAARARFPDQLFVKLSDGVTHYEVAGPEEGPRVVCVVGFASSYFIWDYQIQALSDAGFRVLRYDLYGRGFSERLRGPYDAALFDRQLLELLDAVEFSGAVDLIGLSMGGATTVRFITNHPERVRRFALFAPAGFPVPVKLDYHLLKTPFVGEWLMKGFGEASILKSVPRQIALDAVKSAYARACYLEQMQYKGYKHALVSTLRHNPLGTLKETFEAVGRLGHAGLLFWGTRDEIIPFEHHHLVQAAIPTIQFHALRGAGHASNFEAPEAVNPILVAFLQGKGADI